MNDVHNPHPHVALMALYLEDARETRRPWDRWEVKDISGVWKRCDAPITWYEAYDYRRIGT